MNANGKTRRLTQGEFFRLASEIEKNADEYSRLTLDVATERINKVLNFKFPITAANVRAAAKEAGVHISRPQGSSKAEKLRAMRESLERRIEALWVAFSELDNRVDALEGAIVGPAAVEGA